MAPIRDQAIVLKHLDYSETSQVLAMLTREHGALRLIAKGVRRSTKTRFAVGIDLLERGELLYAPARGDGLGTLTEWRQVDAHLGLRNSLPAWYAAQYAAEATACMTEADDPAPVLFDALAAALAALSRGGAPLQALIEYQRALLAGAGLQPDLSRCVMCDRPAPPNRAGYFSAVHGGLVCTGCEPKAPDRRLVKAATLQAMRTGDATHAPAVFEVLDYAIAAAVGRPMSLAHGVKQVVKKKEAGDRRQDSGGRARGDTEYGIQNTESQPDSSPLNS